MVRKRASVFIAFVFYWYNGKEGAMLHKRCGNVRYYITGEKDEVNGEVGHENGLTKLHWGNFNNTSAGSLRALEDFHGDVIFFRLRQQGFLF